MEKCRCHCAVPPAVKEEEPKAAPEPITTTLPRSAEVDNMSVPIRTIMYVEVGNLPPAEVRDISASLMSTLNPGHPHFIVPLRNGKMNTDLDFEKEFLDFVQLVCEIKDGQIVLKDGCHNVDVIRVRI